MTNSSRFIYNFLVNIFSTGVSVLLGVISIPFLIHFIGVSQFGLISLFSSIFGIASLIEGGMNTAIIRKLSLCAAKSDYEDFNRTFSFSLNVGISFTAIILILSLVFKDSLFSLFTKLSPDLIAEAKKVFGICMLNSGLTSFVLPVVFGLFSTKHRFDLISFFRAAIVSVQVILWYVVLKYTGTGLAGWAVSSLSVTVLFLLIALFVGIRMTNCFRYTFVAFDGGLFRELFMLGGKVSVVKISIFAITYINPILFSMYGSIIYNTIFQVSSKGASIVSMILGNVSGQIVPHIAGYIAKKDMEKMLSVYVFSTRMLFSLMVCIVMLVSANYKYIFFLWVGASMPDIWLYTANVFICLLFIQIMSSPSEIQWPIIMMLNRLGSVTVFYVLRTVVCVSAVIVMLKYTSLGVYSVVVVNAPCVLITILFFMYVLGRSIKISVLHQLLAIFSRGAACAAFLFPTLFAVKYACEAHFTSPLALLLINGAIGSCIAAGVLFFVGFTSADRRRVLSFIEPLANAAVRYRNKVL